MRQFRRWAYVTAMKLMLYAIRGGTPTVPRSEQRQQHQPVPLLSLDMRLRFCVPTAMAVH